MVYQWGSVADCSYAETMPARQTATTMATETITTVFSVFFIVGPPVEIAGGFWLSVRCEVVKSRTRGNRVRLFVG